MARGKQLSIYVPADKIEVVHRLHRLSKSTGKPVNWLVVDAITQYLHGRTPSNAQFRSLDLKGKNPVHRKEIYEEQLTRKLER